MSEMPENAMRVLDKGYVLVRKVSADDLDVVNAARASFNAKSSSMGRREEGLINFLLRNNHSSPLEHGMFSFEVKCPIFVAREWFRHRTSSFNEWSGRYSELAPEFYIPQGNVRTQVGKPGEYEFQKVGPVLDDTICREIEATCNAAFDSYRAMLDRGIAKEVARMVLPLNLYTVFVWTLNPRNLMHFLGLRNHPDAQLEIREYAMVIEAVLNANMPVTAQAWRDHGRQL